MALRHSTWCFYEEKKSLIEAGEEPEGDFVVDAKFDTVAHNVTAIEVADLGVAFAATSYLKSVSVINYKITLDGHVQLVPYAEL